MLKADNAMVMIVDVQAKLVPAMHDRESLLRNLQILIRGARILSLPLLWVEQNPAGLGPTVPEIAACLGGHNPIPKMSFSACGASEVMEALRASGRRQVVLAGLEAHVCIYLTATDLVAEGYAVEVVADAISSRTRDRKEIGMNKIAAAGGEITCTETVLFELLRRAEGDSFKEILRLLK
jgi:nicotinamidase-related amidase